MPDTLLVRKSLMRCLKILFATLISSVITLSDIGASEPMTWQRAIDRDDASALWRLMPDADVYSTNEKGKTALMSAAKLGDLKMMQLLRERGLQLTDRSKTGGTSLMYASLGDQLSMIRFIHNAVDNTAFLDAQSTNGWTALMIASAKGFKNSVRLLIELGADPSLEDAYQWSPLMRAIDNRHMGVVIYLLSLDQVDVNAVNENGSTAVHIAALKNDLQTIELLLGRPELSTDIRDKTGRTALDIAIASDHDELAEVLRKFEVLK